MESTSTMINYIREMLVDRGDDVTTFDDMVENMDKKLLYVSNKNNKLISLKSDRTCVLFALIPEYKKLFLDDIKVKTKTIVEMVENFVEKYDGYINFVVVLFSDKSLTISEKNALQQFDKQLQKGGGMLHDFTDVSFRFNPTRHFLVPPHRKLNADEVKDMMEKMMIKHKSVLPYILRSDPIAKWLGLRIGDVVEIHHHNPNSGLSYYYRCCV